MAKDSSKTTAGELQKIVESRGQKTLKKNCQTAPTLPHGVLLAHPKTISSIFSCQTRLELQMGLASMVR